MTPVVDDVLLSLPPPPPWPPSFGSLITKRLSPKSVGKLEGMTRCFQVTAGPHKVCVHIDRGGVHSQRLWVQCPDPSHQPCFKHRLLHLSPTTEDGVAWVGAWALCALDVSMTLCKHGHLMWAPSDVSVAKVNATIKEL